ncbi:MAG: Ig-like domain-containing protein [Gemmatimonadaceae bacterium]
MKRHTGIGDRLRVVRPLVSRRSGRAVAYLLAAVVSWSCGGGGDGFVNPAGPPIVVTISPNTATINVGATTTFSVSISGGSGSASATLSNCTSGTPSVATAAVNGSSCTATGVAPGTSVITAVTTGGVASALLTVVALPPALTALTLTPPTASITVGQTVSLTAVPTNPAGATVSIAYLSGNTAVATVAASGVVTAVSAGSAVITATAQATGPNLTPTTIAQTSTITVSANPCAAIVLALPVARTGSVTASSCVLTTDIQRRGDVLRVNLAAPTALELRFVPAGFTGYITAFPAAESEFVFFSGNPSQEVRRTWHMPAGLTELRVGAALAGQTGTYSFSAATVSALVTGCTSVVVAGSLFSTQSLTATDCVYSGRIADEFLIYSARSCVITMNRDVTNPMTNPFLEVYAGAQLYQFDNDGGGGTNARISLGSCRSPANDVLTVRATSFTAGDLGNYVFTVTFGQ